MTLWDRIRGYLYLVPPIILFLAGLFGLGRAIYHVIPPITPYLMEYLKGSILLPAIGAIAAAVWWILLTRRDKKLLHKVFMGVSLALILGFGVAVGLWGLYQRSCFTKLEPLRDYYHCNFSDKDLSQSDIHGSDLTQAVLEGTNFHGTNLSEVSLQGQDLGGAMLANANLSGANLNGVNLAGADLNQVVAEGADFTVANLSNADLEDCSLSQANLSRTTLLGAKFAHCDLSGADLSNLDLSEAILTEVDLSGADLSQVNLVGADLHNVIFDEADFTDATLAGAILSGASLDGALLQGADFTEVDFQGANLEQVIASETDFSGADLREATLDGADLRNANLEGATLSGVGFSGVQLEGAMLTGADLKGANLSRLDLKSTDLNQANLTGADLTGSDFSGGDYQGLNLEGTDLTGANLSNATVEESTFTNAILSGVNLTDADLSGNDFNSAIFTGATLSGTRLTGAILKNAQCGGLDLHTTSLFDTDMSGINLAGADLSGRDLSGIDFGKANLTDASFQNSDLSDANLSEADLTGANFKYGNLGGANFSGQDISQIEIDGAYLQSVDFSSAELSEMYLFGVNLAQANLSHARLSNVVLQNADLEDTNLSGAILDGADLRQVDFRDANFQNASLEGSLLTYSDFYGASGLTDEMLDSALGLVNGTFFQPRNEVISALSGVCRGTGAPEAAPYEGVLGLQPAVLLSESGKSHDWSENIPSEWEPTGIRFAQLVVCVEPQSTYVISSTPYCLGTSYCSDPTYLQRHSYQVNVEIRRALEGTIIARQTFYGSAPRAAKNTESWSIVQSGLWGSKVGYSAIESWIKAYIAPRSYTCDDELGCVDVVPGAPLEIGALLAMSGTYEYLGVDALRGMEIATQDTGEVLGHPIHIVELDSECSEDQCEAMAARLAENEWFLGAVGATCGAPTYAAASLLSDEGRVLISPSISTAWLTAPTYHQSGFLRVIPNDLEQAEMVAEFAFRELEARRMATIHEGSVYGVDLQARACEVFNSLGGECVAQEELKMGETDTGQLMDEIAVSSPDVIYMAVTVDSGVELVQQARDISSLEGIPLIGAGTLFNKYFLELSGSDAKDLYISGLAIGTDFYTPQYDDFLEKYNEMYGSSPDGLYHAYGYDSLSLLIQAIKKVAVKDSDGTLHIPRKALRDALYATRYFYGLTGTLNCTAEGDCGEKNSIRIFQFVDVDPSNFNPGKEEDSNPMVVYP